ncbi:MAG TPA: hypothetical protein VHT75_02965 [Acidimicrobiales bacterium]|nr:hypothetical protein [Acidimicrobiales bacterium]
MLLADHEPQTLLEWEQWLAATRKAIRKQAVIAQREPVTADEAVTIQLMHPHCRSRRTAATGIKLSDASASP